VNGLKEQYGDEMAFAILNAGDRSQGEELFKALRLSGHPASLIYQPDGNEAFRKLGSVPETELIAAIDQVLRRRFSGGQARACPS
jgi:hypothetical protein